MVSATSLRRAFSLYVSPRSRDLVHSTHVLDLPAFFHLNMSQVTLDWLTLNVNGRETSKATSNIQKTAITCGWSGPKYVSMIFSEIL
jgi:hypothetical protein